MDIADFIAARLDEDEAAANEVHLPRECGSVDRDGDFDPDPVWCGCGYPARVLREVAAKRAIVAAYEAVAYMDTADPEPEFAYGRAVGLGEAVREIAAVWSGHADYRQEWAP